jgi:hypothetical protein
MNFVYIDLDTGAFPLYQGDIRWQNPEIPELLTGDAFPCPPRYARVVFDPQPPYDADTEQTTWALPPVFDGAQWHVSYMVVPLTEEEKADRVRMLAEFAERGPQPMLAQSPSAPTVTLTYIE